MSRGWLEHQVALVTGGGKGIGRAIARRLAAEGAAVAMCGRDPAAIEATAGEIVASGGVAAARALDVTDHEALDRFVTETRDQFGRLDVLVNNAALTAMSNIGLAPVPDMAIEEWRRVLDVNLTGAFSASRAAARIMREQRAGSIISVSSVHAHVPHAPTPHYDAAKAGLEALTRGLALYFGRYGVRVNAVAPGPIRDPGAVEAQYALSAEMRENLSRATALGRVGDAAEVAAVVAFLASAEASYITGATIPVDGGFLLRHPGMSDGSDFDA